MLLRRSTAVRRNDTTKTYKLDVSPCRVVPSGRVAIIGGSRAAQEIHIRWWLLCLNAGMMEEEEISLTD